MTGTAIRPARPADQARIEAIVDAAYRPYLARMDRKPLPMLDDYAMRIADGQTHVLEAEDGILGLVVLEAEDDHLLLNNIAVDPARHGEGLGRLLMAFSEDEARRQGYGVVVLYTNEVMVENLALYRHLGYVETERRENGGYQRIYMRKVLS